MASMSAAAKMNHYQNAIGLSSILRRAIHASKNNSATNIDLGSVVSFSFDALRALKPWGFIPTEMYSLLSSYPINHIRYIIANHEDLGKDSLVYKLLGTHPKEAMNLLTYDGEPLTTLSLAQLILTSDYTKLGVRLDLTDEEQARLGQALKSFQTSTFVAAKALNWVSRARARVQEREQGGRVGEMYPQPHGYSPSSSSLGQPHLRATSRTLHEAGDLSGFPSRAKFMKPYREDDSAGRGEFRGEYHGGHHKLVDEGEFRGERYDSRRSDLLKMASDSDDDGEVSHTRRKKAVSPAGPSSSFEAVKT
ncbi:MAG: hypothetical protein GWP59_02690 [Chlamydiales bacterium]|nr:hypothetical protein [Chlamydiales bacterium]